MNTFSIIVPSEGQSSSVQRWLEQHTWEHDPQDGVETVPYHLGDGGSMFYKIQFAHPEMSVRPVSAHLVSGMLINRFNWSGHFASNFLSEHGQLLEIWLGDVTCIYYARPLDVDRSEVRIDDEPMNEKEEKA